MSFFRDTDEPDEEFHRACLKGDTVTVRRLLDIEDERLSRSATDPIYGYAHIPLYFACFGGHRETVLLLVRKHVIGPPAEHNGRRIEHLAPHIASFVAPTEKFRPLASDDDSLRDSDSEDEMHHIDY